MRRPAVAVPRHALTAEAVHLLRHTESRLSARAAVRPETTDRIAPTRLGGSADEDRLRREEALFRLVSVTEAFLDALSMEVLQSAHAFAGHPLATMLAEHEIASTANWRRREDAYWDYHSLRLRLVPAYDRVKAAVEVRNSIAHGLGRLTARQRKKSTLLSELALLDVTVGHGRVHLADTTLNLTLTACEEMVLGVDAKMPTT